MFEKLRSFNNKDSKGKQVFPETPNTIHLEEILHLHYNINLFTLQLHFLSR